MVPKSLEVERKWSYLSSQFAKAKYPPKGTSLAGQTIIITGANTGIGFACANSLLELDLTHLIIAVRTVSKGEAAAAKLKQGHPNAKIEVWQLDMLSYKSVQAFSAKCQTLDRIDAAILNAGTVEQQFKMGPEGHEIMYQVNYLSTSLLAYLLLPTLKQKAPAGKPGRLTCVNSGTGLMAKLPYMSERPFLPTFDDKNKFSSTEAYPASKALGHFWIFKLAEYVRAEDVIVNIVDPGLVKGTDLHRNTNCIVKGLFAVGKAVTGRSMEAGASCLIDAAIIKGKETHGSYVMDWDVFS